MALVATLPVFHAVNSNQNHCRPVMELLVDSGANLDLRLKGLVWGHGFDWETLLFDVTPISYAQCGLYFQFHRPEHQIYSNITYLFRKRYSFDPPLRNVPNKYLQDSRVFPPAYLIKWVPGTHSDDYRATQMG